MNVQLAVVGTAAEGIFISYKVYRSMSVLLTIIKDVVMNSGTGHSHEEVCGRASNN